MFWLSMTNLSAELDAIAPGSRPWAIVKGFVRFCNTYGEYHAKPPSERRRFIIERESHQEVEMHPESC
ncbi:MAG: hypothetical protein AAF609_20150 [Cyanobacteria bacterium P01_C01_bin.120]